MVLRFARVELRYKAAGKDTISRWIKPPWPLLGIDLSRFKPYSIRFASASAAAGSC